MGNGLFGAAAESIVRKTIGAVAATYDPMTLTVEWQLSARSDDYPCTVQLIAKRFVIPEFFYRVSMISGSCKLDSRSEALRE
jgi:hypothetical protein